MIISNMFYLGYSITSRFSGEYTKLTLQFGMMKRQCKKLILKKAEECFASLQELLCYSFSEDKDIISEATTTKELLDTVVFPRCTVTNYDLLEGLAKHLKVPGIYREIRKFEKSKEYLKTNIMSEDFAIALNDEISRRRSSNSDHQPRTKIILYVAWANSEATLKEFRILFHDIFPGLYTYIDLELTKEGSVIFVCSAPGYLEGVLIQMARDQTKLALERRVVYLSVGITCIINISAKQQVLTHTHTYTQSHTLTHSHTHTHTLTYIHTHSHTHTHIHTHTHSHTHTHTHTLTYIHTHTLTYIHTHTHSHTYIHTHTHTHTHTYIHTQASPTNHKIPLSHSV